jgi:hypothetical protein
VNNQLTWPPLRTDVMALVCIAIALACLVIGRWPALAVLALVGAIFCSVSPRMSGPFGFQGGGGTQIGGTFDDATGGSVVVYATAIPQESETRPGAPGPDPRTSSKGPDAD